MGCECGESPLWHAPTQSVMWVDIPTGRLFRLACEASGQPIRHAEPETLLEGPAIGAVSVEADGALLLLGAEGHVQRWDNGHLSTLHEALAPGTRFNDCLADEAGRLYSGTMSQWVNGEPDRTGKLFRLDPDGAVHVLDEGFGIPNGMGFTPDGRHLWFTDTTPGRIHRYRRDPATGDLHDREVFFQEPGCGCDGLAVDDAGNLWSARWGGHGVWKHDGLTGWATRAIEVPTEKVTAIAFAGENLDVAWITSAGGNPDDPTASDAGTLFLAEPRGVRGAPRHPSRIACN